MRKEPIYGRRPLGHRDHALLLIAYFDPNGIQTIPEGIQSWQSASRHELTLVNLWPGRGHHLTLPASVVLDEFSGLVIHPSVSYFIHNLESLDRSTADFGSYDGVKILMKQDEQVKTSAFADYIRRKRFDVVLTCVPESEQPKVYPRDVIGEHCRLLQVLTGYVTPEMRTGFAASARTIDISYRGSIQPLEFGRLGFEKRAIGDSVAAHPGVAALSVDISSRWEDRVTGDHWADFLTRSRFVLGVESGSNLFDFDGSVAAWCDGYRATTKDLDPLSPEFYLRADAQFLHRYEGNVDYAQISPRHFEAAAAGAGQIMYEGRYSDLFQPHRHFVPLKRDLSNMDEVLDTVKDDGARRIMAERSFEEVILDPRNWYETFISRMDDVVDAEVERKGTMSRRLARPKPTARRKAFVLCAHNPTIDPRINWFASSLRADYDVTVFGTYDFGKVGTGPSLMESHDGLQLVQVERTKHSAAWLPSSGQLSLDAGSLIPKALLAAMVGYAAAPAPFLAERLGAHDALDSEIARFRGLCAYFVDTNSALIEAVEKSGVPDVVVAADLEALPAAAAIRAETGAFAIYDAHEYWPFSYTDFRHWEIAFWQSIERQLCKTVDMHLTVSPQLAREMSTEYGETFANLPNCCTLAEGSGLDLEGAYAARLERDSLTFLFQGAFAEGRGLEGLVRAWEHVRSGARLVCRGPDNEYKRSIVALARSLGLEGTRVFFPPAVPESALVAAAVEADVGVISYDPAFFGYRYCCPNKLSQYCAAGLPILSSSTEYVAGVVTQEDIGRVVDVANPAAIARSVDAMAADRQELVRQGRRARRFFEASYHWEAKFQPVAERLQAGTAGRPPAPGIVDLAWMAAGSAKRRSAARQTPIPPSVFGTDRGAASINVALADAGASITGSSPFHPRPNDADALLRSGAYAAVLEGAPLPHWVEVDLGKPRAVDGVLVGWFDAANYAADYTVEVRLAPKESWHALVAVRDNVAPERSHDFAPRWTRYVRLSVSRCAGQPRLLMRSFEILETSRFVPPLAEMAAHDSSPTIGVRRYPSLRRLAQHLPAGLRRRVRKVEQLVRGLRIAAKARPPRPAVRLDPTSALDVVMAEYGASIAGSSSFFDSPNDATWLLLPPSKQGYAAGLNTVRLPHWFEVDLGAPRLVDTTDVGWFDASNYAADYTLEGRLNRVVSWDVLAEVSDNVLVERRHAFKPREVRYLRLTVSVCVGQQRLLMRRFSVFQSVVGAPADVGAADPVGV